MRYLIVDIKNELFIGTYDGDEKTDAALQDYLVTNNYQAILREDELKASFTGKQLLQFYNDHAEKPIKKFADLKSAARRTFELLSKCKPTTLKKKSKLSKLLELMDDCEMHTVEEITEYTGFDKNNLMTMISILKNPNKTKNPVIIIRIGGMYRCEK